MAKLSSNGTEVGRYRRIRSKELLDAGVHDSMTEMSLRSNGWILRRVVTWFVDVYRPSGVRRVDHGWKRWQKCQSASAEDVDAVLIRAGYTKVEAKS